MRIKAVVTRIIRQFFRDRRTLALLLIAPIFVLTLMNYVFEERDYPLTIGVQNEAVEKTVSTLKDDHTIKVITKDEANSLFEEGELDAFITASPKGMTVTVEGADSGKTKVVMNEIQQSIKGTQQTSTINIENYFGNDDMEMFDSIGPVLLGFFIFFFVFLISGVSFLRERTTGTLERLLATPIKRYEIVIGYLLGFGLFTILQSSIVAAFTIYILDVYSTGSFWLIIVVAVAIALAALSLGMFLSAFANNELQMIQFIPLIIVPQAFFSGLFPIEGMIEPLQWLSKVMPLTYAAEALRSVMIRGAEFADILVPLSVLLGFTIVFAVLNVVALKKHRTW